MYIAGFINVYNSKTNIINNVWIKKRQIKGNGWSASRPLVTIDMNPWCMIEWNNLNKLYV